MLVRANTLCAIKGSRRRPGEIFEYSGPLPHKYLDIVEEGAPAPILDVEEPKQQMGAKKQRNVKDLSIHEQSTAIPSVI